jgi:hypothetical protein
MRRNTSARHARLARRLFGSVALSWVVAFAPAADAAPPTWSGKQFLIDDFLVDRMEGLQRQLHPAAKRGVVKDNEKAWETASGGNYVQVFKDGDRWHMYYSGVYWRRNPERSDKDTAQEYRCLVCYATSNDGLKWTRPVIGRIEAAASAEGGWNGRHYGVGSSKENNALLEGQLSTGYYDPQRRLGKPILLCVSGNFFMSDDWKNFEPVGTPPPRRNIQGLLYNEVEKRWELYTQGVKGPEFPRMIGRQLSPDLNTWTSEPVIRPDEKDHRLTKDYDEFMSMSVRREPGLTLGFITVFHGDRTDSRYTAPGGYAWRKGTCDVQLTCTRDGKDWIRVADRKTWIPHGPEEHSYDRLIMLSNGGVRNGDELWFYYEAWDGDHLTHDANGKVFYPDGRVRVGRVALATIRLDGYLSLRADDREGVLTTKPFTVGPGRLFVNTQANGGELRVEVLDAAGQAVEGFTAKDCASVRGDDVHASVTWAGRKTLEPLLGKVIRLRFHLRKCDLYTFSLEK